MDDLYLPANLNSSLQRSGTTSQKHAIERTRLSDEMKDFIINVLGETPTSLLSKPVLTLPASHKPQHFDDTHPLTHYFISSSHNTYLLSRQLLGTSSVKAYTHVLLRGCACVEIDLWWRGSKAKKGREERGEAGEEDGLRVTHGWTLSSEVGFEDVCLAIRDAIKVLENRHRSPSAGSPSATFPPILISLENHVPAQHQHHLINVLKRTLSPWLVLGKIDGIDDSAIDASLAQNSDDKKPVQEGVRLKDLRGRVVVMVEYYPGDPVGNTIRAVGEARERRGRVHKAKKSGSRSSSSSSSSSSSRSRSSSPQGQAGLQEFELSSGSEDDSGDDLDLFEIPEDRSGSASQLDLELSSGSSDEDDEKEGQEDKKEGSVIKRIWPIRRRHDKDGEGDGQQKKKKHRPRISAALAELGYYCRSMKPGEGWWGIFIHDPKHILINISESAHEPLLFLAPIPLPSLSQSQSSSSHPHSLSDALSRLHIHPSSDEKQHTPLTPLQSHSLSHLRRVYPKGTRIRSGNMLPSKYWRSGTQVVGVNWQKMDVGGEVGVGMFVVGEGGGDGEEQEEKEEGEGEDGKEGRMGIESMVDTAPVLRSEEGISYILKPSWLRGDVDARRMRLVKVEVWGGCGVTPPKGHEDGKEFGLYIKTELYCANVERHHWIREHLHLPHHHSDSELPTAKGPNPDQVLTHRSSTVKTRQLSSSPPPGCDFSFSSSHEPCKLEWEYFEDELAFLRIGIYRDERWGKDDLLGWFCARTVYLPQEQGGGWRAVKMMDGEGRFRGGVLLVRFELVDV